MSNYSIKLNRRGQKSCSILQRFIEKRTRPLPWNRRWVIFYFASNCNDTVAMMKLWLNYDDEIGRERFSYVTIGSHFEGLDMDWQSSSGECLNFYYLNFLVVLWPTPDMMNFAIATTCNDFFIQSVTPINLPSLNYRSIQNHTIVWDDISSSLFDLFLSLFCNLSFSTIFLIIYCRPFMISSPCSVLITSTNFAGSQIVPIRCSRDWQGLFGFCAMPLR